jgi:hypothetical protein
MAGRRLDRPEVFCGTCQYYRPIRYAVVCTHPNAWYAVTTAVAVEYARHAPQERNAENDCADFHPLGWWQRFRRGRGVEISLVVGVWLVLYVALVLWGGARP